MSGINFDFTTGALPGGITFTRPSIATYFDSGGILRTASANAARFNYIGGVACLLIEPAATNLLFQSNNFAAGPWFSSNGSVATAAQFVSPDGTNNGWAVTSGSGFGAMAQDITFAAVQYTMSVWAKRIVGSAPTVFRTAAVNGGDIPTPVVIARLSSTLTPAAGLSDAFIFVDLPSANTNGWFGAQLETGPVPTSYIPTTTGAATRAADSAVFTIPAGVSQLTYTFDDNSTQVVAVSAGAYTIPVTLTRRNIKGIVGVQVAQQIGVVAPGGCGGSGSVQRGFAG